MSTAKKNPKAPCRAAKGSGVYACSAAIDLDYITPASQIVQRRLQQRFAISAAHAQTLARLAGLGPQEAFQ